MKEGLRSWMFMSDMRTTVLCENTQSMTLLDFGQVNTVGVGNTTCPAGGRKGRGKW